MTVREATLADLDFLVERSVMFNARHYDVPLNIDKLVAYLTQLICEPIGVLLVADRGMIGGILVDDPIRDWTVLVETGWFSEGRDGLRLLTAFENRGRLIGVDEVRMTTLEGNPDAQRILQRRGYSAIETSHRLLI